MTLTFDLLLDGREVDVALDGAATTIDYDLNVDSTLAVTIGVRDQQRVLFKSGILDRNDDGRLDRLVEILLDGAWYRLASFNKAGDTFTLGFEDRSAARMRAARGKLKPRAGEDHVRFVKQLCARAGVPFATPTGVVVTESKSKAKQKTQRVEADTRREKGIASGAKLKVKGATANANQLQNMEIVLGQCAKDKASPKATLACVLACIVEDLFRNSLAVTDGTSVGILQLLAMHLGGSTSTKGGRRDIPLVIHLFLTKGFTGKGGAIAVAKANPGMSAGIVAATVQGPRADLRGEYDKYRAEGEAIVAAFHGGSLGSLGSGASTTSVSRAAALVQRGTPEDPNESSWAAAQRIGKAKGYRLFCDRNTVIYADEHDLIASRARAILSEDRPGVDWIDGEQVPGKKINTATASVLASLWALPPGCAVIVKDTGPLDGRWLVSSFKRSRYSVRASVELRRGTELLQPEATQELATSSSSSAIGGTSTTVASAVSGTAKGGSWTAPPGGAHSFRGPKAALLNELAGIAQNDFHLRISATTNGNHVANSFHFSGRAFDAAGTVPNMKGFAEYIMTHHRAEMQELIFNDDHGGYGIDAGRRVNGATVYAGVWAGHRDHVHSAA